MLSLVPSISVTHAINFHHKNHVCAAIASSNAAVNELIASCCFCSKDAVHHGREVTPSRTSPPSPSIPLPPYRCDTLSVSSVTSCLNYFRRDAASLPLPPPSCLASSSSSITLSSYVSFSKD
ncbi:hypothetical protein HN51_030078 [Arachis hypogaea]